MSVLIEVFTMTIKFVKHVIGGVMHVVGRFLRIVLHVGLVMEM